MNKLSFMYCPICSEELDGHPVRKFFRTHDKLFIVRALGKENRAGYCKNCNKIFAEFEVTDEI